MKTLLDAFLIGLLSAIVIPVLDYVLTARAERPPVRCDGGMEINGHKVEMFRWLSYQPGFVERNRE